MASSDPLDTDKTAERPEDDSVSAALSADTLLGQYRIVRGLGRGGMGEVYEAEHRVLRRRYALKLLPASFADSTQAVKRFEREAQVMANLDHPNIIKVDEFGETDGRYWVRMELATGVEREGRRLTSLRDYAGAAGGRIGQRFLAAILKQILSGLDYAHSYGVIHRDLKPSNILLITDEAGETVVKVADFGLVKLIGEDWVLDQAQQSVKASLSVSDADTEVPPGTTDSLVGTFEYMSPEQKRGEDTDARSDLYALGVMVYRLLTGRRSVGMEAPSSIDPALVPAWDRFLKGALATSPSGRYGSAAEMAGALARVREALAAQPAPPEIAPAAPAPPPPEQVSTPLAEQPSEPAPAPLAEQPSERVPAPVDERPAGPVPAPIAEQSSEQEPAPVAEQPAEEAVPLPRSGVAAALGLLRRVKRAWLLAAGAAVLLLCVIVAALVAGKGDRVPEDLIAVEDAAYALLDGLAEGSAEAQQRQKQAVEVLGLPLEAKTRNAGVHFRLIPAGLFTMGSSDDERDAMVAGGAEHRYLADEGPQHRVVFSKPFYCGKLEVTQGQWALAASSAPSKFKAAGEDAPVEQVSWDGCQEFLKRLCRLEGVPEGTYRLLTEAEWEYCCRAGSQTALCNGDLTSVSDECEKLERVGWYDLNSGGTTHPAGQKMPNAWGLHDMHGNVWEWCADWYDAEYYQPEDMKDPAGPESGDERVQRGGSWRYHARNCRSAGRVSALPDTRKSNLGFRLARTIASMDGE